MNTDIILVCWSFSQASVRIETLVEHVELNLRAFRENRRVDHVSIAAFATMDEAGSFFEENRALIEHRFDVRRRERGL